MRLSERPIISEGNGMHTRETTTDGDLFDPPEPGKFIVDCSCGETYLVDKPAWHSDEFDRLEAAAERHAAVATG